MSKPRLIAFYLPQYFPTKENDEWWMPGFTEWTNVAKAKPLFKGHYQPKIPRELSFYDLRVPEVREQQALLAREAGIEGFCYWHYWFNGQRLLDRVFREVVESGHPDFPFCLCWANHSWYRKTWNPKVPNKLLIEQTYPGEKDYIAHFNAMLPAFKDKRYMKVNGRNIFGVFDTSKFEFKHFKEVWDRLAVQNGLQPFYFFGFTFHLDELKAMPEKGYDASVLDGSSLSFDEHSKALQWLIRARRKILGIPTLIKYKDYQQTLLSNYTCSSTSHLAIVPNFDHSPRSGTRGTIMVDTTPGAWGKFAAHVFGVCKDRTEEENLVFVKAWNEWGEGNYMEPDIKYGKGFITELRKAYDHAE